MTADVFINCRKEDGGDIARRIFDRLVEQFENGQIFLCLGSSEVSGEYLAKLPTELWRCSVFITVIGQSWLSATDGTGRRQLDDPDNPGRKEIEIALRRSIFIIPVLVNSATMPKIEELPDSLKPLANRDAIRIRHDTFGFDYAELEEAVANALGAIASVPSDIDVVLRKPYTLKSPCSSAELSKASEIAGHFFPEENIDPSVIRAIHEKSPNSFLVLIEEKTRSVVGYADLFVIRQEKLDQFESGHLAEYDLAAQDFLALDERAVAQDVNLYLGGIAIMEHQRFERQKCATVLIYGLLRIAFETLFHKKDSWRVYAVALSTSGAKLLRNLGFTVIKRHEDRRGDGDLYRRVIRRSEIEPQLLSMEIARYMANIEIRTQCETSNVSTRKRNPDLSELDLRIEDVELQLRTAIAAALNDDPNRLPSDVKHYANERVHQFAKKNMVADLSHFRALTALLEFCDLRELEKIITNKLLWPSFQARFASKEAVAAKFCQLADLRNPIRHSRTVDEIVKLEGEAAIRWFERVLVKSFDVTLTDLPQTPVGLRSPDRYLKEGHPMPKFRGT